MLWFIIKKRLAGRGYTWYHLGILMEMYPGHARVVVCINTTPSLNCHGPCHRPGDI